jgi:hypothetical protein
MPIFTFGPVHLVHPAQEITDYVEHLIAQLASRGLYYRGPDRRSEERHRVSLPVMAAPLDLQLKPIGERFVATTRDISNGGIAIVHSAFIDSDCRFFAVELHDSEHKYLQAAVEILRRNSLGPFFEVAGRFVTKVRRYDPFVSSN